jgi:hypothetical protein
MALSFAHRGSRVSTHFLESALDELNKRNLVGAASVCSARDREIATFLVLGMTSLPLF